jgi:hypothetical protein
VTGCTDRQHVAPARATGRRGLRAAAAAFACTSAYATVVSIRDDLPGRPLRIGIPLSVPVALLVGWGAAVAAPWPMPVAAIVAATRAGDERQGARAALVCMGVGIAGMIGLLMEPNTYAARSHSRANRRAIALGLSTTGALAVTGLHRWRALVAVSAAIAR